MPLPALLYNSMLLQYIASDHSFAINRNCILVLLYPLIKKQNKINHKIANKVPSAVKQSRQPQQLFPEGNESGRELNIQGIAAHGVGGIGFVWPLSTI